MHGAPRAEALRVAMVISAPGWRGSGVSFAKVARGLRARGHVVRLVTATPSLTSRLLEEGLDVTLIPGPSTGPREVWALRRTLDAVRAQAIVVDTPRDLRLAWYATLFDHARIVYRYNVHHQRPRPMDRVYLGRVAAGVYQSRYIQDEAVAHAPRMARMPAYHVPNGFDTATYAPRPGAGLPFRDRYGIAPTARVVLSAGALTPGKGHEVAIAALSRSRHEGMDVVYVACGEGHLEGDLVSIARQCGLPSVFPGILGTEDMVLAYNAADLVVHPSLHEIFPNAVGEAMACGRPVIAADTGGTNELLGTDGTTGVLVPRADVGALAESVARLLAEPGRSRSMGEAARRRIEQYFPLHGMVDGYEAALREVTAAGG